MPLRPCNILYSYLDASISEQIKLYLLQTLSLCVYIRSRNLGQNLKYFAFKILSLGSHDIPSTYRSCFQNKWNLWGVLWFRYKNCRFPGAHVNNCPFTIFIRVAVTQLNFNQSSIDHQLRSIFLGTL